jgi:hypothetical protein
MEIDHSSRTAATAIEDRCTARPPARDAVTAEDASREAWTIVSPPLERWVGLGPSVWLGQLVVSRRAIHLLD